MTLNPNPMIDLVGIPLGAQAAAIRRIAGIIESRPVVAIRAPRSAWIACGLLHEELFCHGIDAVILVEDYEILESVIRERIETASERLDDAEASARIDDPEPCPPA